jgi:ureidoglycolate dehydrogenase (NAD+)
MEGGLFLEDVIVEQSRLKELVVDKLTKEGLSNEQALTVADVLVHADLRGVGSHGVLRTEHYAKRLNEGGINRTPNFSINRTSSASAIFDGDNGIGHVIAKKAMDQAIELAEKSGIGIVGVINSSHCGALSYFVQQAIKKNKIGMAMTQTDKIVVPFGGARPYFGTNPLAFGFPAKRNKPVILDMATSNVAFGKVLHARKTGKEVPLEWGVNKEGVPTSDPNQIISLLSMGGAKGYGLAMVVDILSGILTGSTFGPHITPMYDEYNKYRKLGHFFCAIDPQIFITQDDFLNQIDQMIDEIHQLKPAEGINMVMVPGEPEQIQEEKRSRYGIPIPKAVYKYLASKK